jgi:hypothetical protein
VIFPSGGSNALYKYSTMLSRKLPRLFFHKVDEVPFSFAAGTKPRQDSKS